MLNLNKKQSQASACELKRDANGGDVAPGPSSLGPWNLRHAGVPQLSTCLRLLTCLRGGFLSYSATSVIPAWLEIIQLWRHRISNRSACSSGHEFLHHGEISLGKFWKQGEMLKEFGEDCFLHGKFWVQLSCNPNLEKLENFVCVGGGGGVGSMVPH